VVLLRRYIALALGVVILKFVNFNNKLWAVWWSRTDLLSEEMRILVVIVENRSSQTMTVVAEYIACIYIGVRLTPVASLLFCLVPGIACFSYDRYTRPSPIVFIIIFDCIHKPFPTILFVRYNQYLVLYTHRTATTIVSIEL